MTVDAAIRTDTMIKWKSEIRELIRLKAGPDATIDDEALDIQLNKIIKKNFKDVPATLHNNYTKTEVRTTLFQMVSILASGRGILGGDACIYRQHKDQLSINVPIISELQKGRKQAKKMRKQYEKGSAEYIYWDNKQKNIKIIINSLYGVTGYSGFHFYNIHLAQSVTAIGQAIISVATCGYENFMANNIRFVNISEMLHYINNVITDFRDTIRDNEGLYESIEDVEPWELAKALNDKAAFKLTDNDANLVAEIISNLDRNCIKLLYYKNNISAFNKTKYMRKLIRALFDNIDVMTLGDPYAFQSPKDTGSIITEEAPMLFEELRNAYRVMVQYNYVTFDKVRRTRYTDKKAVLYIDTDSNFIGLDPFVRFVCDDIYGGRYADYDNMRFKISSVYTMILSDTVARNFVKFTESLNIDPEYGKILGMKNEYFYTRMAFSLVKKRYYGWMMIQEGVMIKDGKGDLAIAGFDFIKAGTKAAIRNKYEEIILKILRSEHIQIRSIIDEAMAFKKHIMGEILDGHSEYFKQVTVSVLERYKKPFSQQGIKGVLIWNALSPDNVLDLPAEVDIIHIKLSEGYTPKRVDAIKKFGPTPDLSNPDVYNTFKMMPELCKFAQKYPDRYEGFYNKILDNSNPQISDMEFNVIAKPRYLAEIPNWLRDIINADKIIMDTVSLLTPVLQVTGIKLVGVGTKKTAHYTNIVEV